MNTYTALALALLALAPAMASASGTEASATSGSELAERNRALAEQAQRESVADAAESLRDSTRLDLDIELVGRTSIAVAGEL